MPLVPLIGMTTTLHIIMGVGWTAISVYAIWISVGLVVYFTYGICLSHQARTYPHKRDESVAESESDAVSGVEDTDALFDETEDE